MSTVHPFVARAPALPDLLCLHGSGSSGRQWAPYAAALSPRLDVQAPNLLGYAASSGWTPAMPLSLDDEVDALAGRLPADGAHVFGHSYGGAVALQLALRWPERVLSLTLYEPVRFALLFGFEATRAAGDAILGVGRRIGVDTLAGAVEAAAARFVDYWSGVGTWPTLPPHRQQMLMARMPKVRAEFEALFADAVPARAYRALTMPVQLIGGVRSPLPARQVLDRLSVLLPHSTRTLLPGLGHLGPVDAPQQVLAALQLLPTDVRDRRAA